MIDTKLILFEGPPGSGKSTTAQIIAEELMRSGKSCQFFFEWSQDHPIAIGSDLELDKVVETAIEREGEVLRQWQKFAKSMQTQDLLTVLESRFWQTSVMLMYADGYPVEGVRESNLRVVEAIRGLNPMMIYFTIDDVRAFTMRTIQIKEAEWQRAGFPGTWAGHVYDALYSRKWFTDRGLTGLEGLYTFLEDWAVVAEGMYERLPFPKIKIPNPHLDWGQTMQKIRGFIGLSS